MIKKKIIALVLLSASSQWVTAQTGLTAEQYPDEWPDSRYTVNANGTVTDKDTGLMWKQCSEGLSGINCATGAITLFTWKAALAKGAETTAFATHTDWRLPNVKELKSLVALNCYSPSINEAVFPATTPSGYWSSSPFAFNSNVAGLVNFSYGNDNYDDRGFSNYVRLVR